MPIKVTCHACNKSYRLRDDLSGKRFKCKQCGEVLTAGAAEDSTQIPRPKQSATPTAPRQKKKRPTKKRPKEKLEPIPDPFANDYEKDDTNADNSPLSGLDDFGDDYGDDFGDDPDNEYADSYDDYSAPARPRKKKKKKSSGKSRGFRKSKSKSIGGGLPPMTFNINRLNIGLVIVGGILIFVGFRELRLAAGSSSTPKEVALSEVYADGAGDEIYLTINGIAPASDGYVATETKLGHMSEVWYACVPAGNFTEPRFIVYSTNAHTEDEVGALMQTPTHTGMLINSVKGLDSETKSLLQQGIPGIDVDNALIFQEGRHPAGFLKYGGFLLGGLVVLLGGLFWIFFLHE